ncbi:MAG: hypothetical protein AMXMBFR13_18350 [Phycisphaerae bacterium]
MNLRQKIFLGVVFIANAALWLTTSDVAHLVVRDRPVVLGRYSQPHFTAILLTLLFSCVGLYIDQARSRETYKRRWFQVLAVVIFMIPGLFVLDLALRTVVRPSYIHTTAAYHRPPEVRLSYTFRDVPATGFIHAHAPDGHAPVPCTYQADAWGYRNRQVTQPVDVVTLGDSFTEGCNVSDDQAWPVLFASDTGLSVYNLGMTGYSPLNNRAALAEHLPRLRPRQVLCMIYEGNDFEIKERELKRPDPTWRDRIRIYYKNSPLRRTYDALLSGPLNTGGVPPDPRIADLLSWLPLWIPQENGHPYVFGPKALLDHAVPYTAFVMSGRWERTADMLADMQRICTDQGAELIIVLAPTKAHVVLPLVRDRLPADKLRAFAELVFPFTIDEASFAQQIFDNLDAREQALARFCRVRGIPFISLTVPLRRAIANGEHAYYTYDHHWTPRGNAIVAATLARARSK